MCWPIKQINVGPDNSKSRSDDDKEYLIDKDSWSSISEEIYLDYEDKLDKLIFECHTVPCLLSDGFSKTNLEHSYTIIWFSTVMFNISYLWLYSTNV